MTYPYWVGPFVFVLISTLFANVPNYYFTQFITLLHPFSCRRVEVQWDQCNTIQHTATRYNTLQHTTTHIAAHTATHTVWSCVCVCVMLVLRATVRARVRVYMLKHVFFVLQCIAVFWQCVAVCCSVLQSLFLHPCHIHVLFQSEIHTQCHINQSQT